MKNFHKVRIIGSFTIQQNQIKTSRIPPLKNQASIHKKSNQNFKTSKIQNQANTFFSVIKMEGKEKKTERGLARH